MTPEERTLFIAELKTALMMDEHCLSADEQQWVRLAIVKQQQSIALRQAIIEKSLTGLVWSAIVGLGFIFLGFLKSQGYK